MDATTQKTEIKIPGTSMFRINSYTIALFCVLAAHFTFHLWYFQPASSGHDSHGYTVQAKQIAEHSRVWFNKESPLQFIGDHWLQYDENENRMFSRYPPGLPVVYALIYSCFGYEAVFLFNHILSTLTLLGLYLLCRFWTRELCAMCAVLVMTTNPVLNSWASQGDSHLLVAFCLIWGLYCLAHWAKSYSILMAVTAGLLLGWIPITRYAEAVYAPAIAAYMLLYYKPSKAYWLSFSAAVITASLPLLCLAVHNLFVLESLFKNGYTTDANSPIFAVSYFQQKFFSYLINIHIHGLGWFATLGFIGFFTLLHSKDTRKEGVLLVGISLATLFLYMAYFFNDPSQRFLLPTYPLYIIAGVWCFHILMQHKVKGAQTVLLILTITMSVWCTATSVKHIQRFHRSNSMYVDATKVIKETIQPSDAYVIVSHKLGRHLMFVSEYHLIDYRLIQPQPPAATRSIEPPQEEDRIPRRPPTPPPRGMGFNQRKIFQESRERYQSNDMGLSQVFLTDLATWSNHAKVYYWIGEKDKILPQLPIGDSYEMIGTFEFDLSERRPPPPQRGRNGGPNNSGPSNNNRTGPPELDGLRPFSNSESPRARREALLRRTQINPVTVSIIKWIRNGELLYDDE